MPYTPIQTQSMQSLPEPVDPEVAEEMFDFADKDKVVVFVTQNMHMSRVLNYRHSFYSFSEDQIKLQDKKIGWEEFQIMIAPPPPPKAPTPHKEKFLCSEL